MKLRLLTWIAAMVFVGVALSEPPSKSTDPQEVPEKEGKELVQRACGQCHSFDVVISQPHSREEWTEVVARMIGNGARLSDDEYNLIIDYLSTHYAPSVSKRPANGD